jgi:RNA polymerase sigma-70 factor (ECF subfamily)
MTAIDEALSERELAEAAIRGDEQAFQQIYERFSLRVFNLVLRSVHERATAEDVCQDVWLKAHREIRSLNSPEALRTWLFRMASRACIDYSRSRACRERGSPEVTEEMLDAPSDEPERVAERRAELRVMWEALAAMPPRQSLALYLKQVEGCSYDEIGRMLNCPKSAVETLLFRARQGFAKTHQQLRDDPGTSCKLISQSMAVVMDREASQFQERAVEAHVNECRPCRLQMQAMTRGAMGYGWLPILPLGSGGLFSILATSTGGAGVGLGLGRILGTLLLKAKAASTVAVVVGTVGTTAAAAGAATGVTPTPADIVTLVNESVGSTSSNEVLLDDRDGGPQDAGDDASGTAGESSGRTPGASAPGGGGGGSTGQTPGGLPPAGGIDPNDPGLGGLPGLLPGEEGGGPLAGAGETVEDVLDGVGTIVEGTLDGVTDTVAGALEDVSETVGEILDDPVGAVTEVLDDPVGTVGDVVDTVDDVVDGTTDTTDGTVDDTTDVVDEVTGGELGDVTDTVDDTVDDVTDVVDDLLPPLGPPEEPEEPAEEDDEGGCLLGLLC